MIERRGNGDLNVSYNYIKEDECQACIFPLFTQILQMNSDTIYRIYCSYFHFQNLVKVKTQVQS